MQVVFLCRWSLAQVRLYNKAVEGESGLENIYPFVSFFLID